VTQSREDLALEAALRVMGPFAEVLLREGVGYPRFANALKTVFLDCARRLLEQGGVPVSDSAVSAMSGVHRKDVRVWREAGEAPATYRQPNLVTAVYAKWATDPAYCDARGRPKSLVADGQPGSFDELAYSVSKDVRPGFLLNEMIRLGVVKRIERKGKGERLELDAKAFVPREGRAEMLRLFADNVGDHVAAAASNLADGDPMLEQAVYADEFTAQAVDELHALAREIWLRGFKEFVREATRLNERDRGRTDADRRLRFGMYCYRGRVRRR